MIGAPFEIVSASFDLTYEELKHIFLSFQFQILFLRFDLTYEELKLFCILNDSPSSLVLILPMRN